VSMDNTDALDRFRDCMREWNPTWAKRALNEDPANVIILCNPADADEVQEMLDEVGHDSVKIQATEKLEVGALMFAYDPDGIEA
jgi:hypothetical protein